MQVYCPRCHSFMELAVYGIDVPWGVNGDVRRGDLYRCQVCGKEVVTNFSEPHPPPRVTRLTPDSLRFNLPLEVPAH